MTLDALIDQRILASTLGCQLDQWRKGELLDLIATAKASGCIGPEKFEQCLLDAQEYAGAKERPRGPLKRAVFSGNTSFMEKASNRYFKSDLLLIAARYLKQPDRLPQQFSSNAEAYDFLKQQTALYKAIRQAQNDNKPVPFGAAEAIEVLKTAGIALTRDTREREPVMYVYDYDKQLYTVRLDILKTWLTAIMGVSSPSTFQTFYQTLEATPGSFAVFNPPPPWKIAVGNGMLDLITKELTPSTPAWTVTRRIATNYVADAEEPRLPSGKTFETLIDDLANHSPARVKLIKQMCKTIITGFSPKPSCFIIHGRGGDGKSLFMRLMSGVVGRINTGIMSITDLNKQDVLYANCDASLVIGYDNDAKAVLAETGKFKSLVTNEPFTVSRKYLSAVPVSFQGTIVELCNEMPRILETGSSIKRRIVVISARNSHYEKSDELEQLEDEINDPVWHEYILRYIVDDGACPFFTDYEDIDADMLNSTLNADDLVGQFVETLIEQGVITPDTRYVPIGLMYACYLDWLSVTNPHSGKLGSRSFTLQLRDRLTPYGFRSREDARPVRITSIMHSLDGSVQEGALEPLRGDSVDGYIAKNTVSRVLERSAPDVSQKVNLSGRRVSKICDVHEFFKSEHALQQFIELHPQLFADIAKDELGMDSVVEEARARVTGIQRIKPLGVTPPDDDDEAVLDIHDLQGRKRYSIKDATLGSAAAMLADSFRREDDRIDKLKLLSSIELVVNEAFKRLTQQADNLNDMNATDRLASLKAASLEDQLSMIIDLTQRGVISDDALNI